ncbi:hypothetical protein, partial [Salmonella sp. SKLX083119]|uniref:hypothetical protein n=1 Tax=Salmonella sp. SKLX083119 TaxID=3159983 RepID=UPI00375436F5
MELHELSAVALAHALRHREVGAVEVVKHFLDRAGRDDCGAFVALTPELALARARALDEAPP